VALSDTHARGSGFWAPREEMARFSLLPLEVIFVLLAASAAFTVSAAAGLGGSLILVPALALVLGRKKASRSPHSCSRSTMWSRCSPIGGPSH
jgi:hypothetical protein